MQRLMLSNEIIYELANIVYINCIYINHEIICKMELMIKGMHAVKDVIIFCCKQKRMRIFIGTFMHAARSSSDLGRAYICKYKVPQKPPIICRMLQRFLV